MNQAKVRAAGGKEVSASRASAPGRCCGRDALRGQRLDTATCQVPLHCFLIALACVSVGCKKSSPNDAQKESAPVESAKPSAPADPSVCTQGRHQLLHLRLPPLILAVKRPRREFALTVRLSSRCAAPASIHFKPTRARSGRSYFRKRWGAAFASSTTTTMAGKTSC